MKRHISTILAALAVALTGIITPPAAMGQAVAKWAVDVPSAEGRAVLVDRSGNVVVTGTAGSNIFTAKYSGGTGSAIWTRSYSNELGLAIVPNAMALDVDGNVIVTGKSLAFSDRIYTAKYRAADGVLLWERVFAGISTSRPDVGYAVAVDGNGDVVIGGTSREAATFEDIYVAKYAGVNGAVLWEKRLSGGTAHSEGVFALALDADGNAVVTGQAEQTPGTLRHYLAKYASGNGATMWERYAAFDARIYEIAVDGAGNVAVVGNPLNQLANDIYTAKFNGATGAVLWEQFYNGRGNGVDYAYAMAVDSGGNILMSGHVQPTQTTAGLVTVKYAGATGALLWERTYVPPAANAGSTNGLAVDEDGNVAMMGPYFGGGAIAGAYYVAKYAAVDGAVLWEQNIPLGNTNSFFSNNLVTGPGGSVVVTGKKGPTTMFTVKFGPADTATDAPTLTAPAPSAVAANPVSVSFSLPEAALAGSVTLSFGSTVLTLANSQGTAGVHAFAFNPAAPSASSQVASGAAVVDGTYTVTLRYQDALGNPAASAVATGVVVDTTAPTFSLPANIIAEATSAAGAVVTYTASASDVGSGVASSSFLPGSGSTFPFGTTTVNASATDNAANTGTGSFTVTVMDTVAPTIGGAFSPLSIVAGTALPDYTVQATTFDAVGVTSVTQSPAAGSATVAGTIAVTLTAYDAAGHTADVLFNVTVTPADPITTLLASKLGAVPGAGAPGSGIPAGAVWSKFGVPSVNDAGQAVVLASFKVGSVTTTAILGFELADLGTMKVVAKKGDAAPGITNAVISAVKEPLLGPDGSVAWVATLANATGTTGAVLPVDNAAIFLDADGAGAGAAVVVARKGGAIFGGAVFAGFTSVALGENAVAFTVTLVKTGGVTTLSDTALCVYNRATSTTATALREGDGFLSSTVKTIGALSARPGSAGQGHGVVPFPGGGGSIVARVTLADNRQVIEGIGEDGSGRPHFVAGEPAVGFGPGALWASFGLPTQNSVSAFAFLGTVKPLTGTATTANNVAIFAESDGDIVPARLVGKGDSAGVAGGTFSALKDPVSAGNSTVAFRGTMKTDVVAGIGAANNDGVWSFSEVSGLDLVAREGAQPPEAPAGAKWKAFTSLALPEGRGPLFVATMHSKTGTASPGPGGITTANDVGLWATDSLGALRLLLQEGDAIGASTVKTFTVLSSVVGSPAQTRSFNNSGSVIVKATDATGAQHLLHIAVP